MNRLCPLKNEFNIIYIIILATLCSGCGNVKHTEPKTAIHANAMRAQLLSACGSHTVNLLDESYWSPSEKWINAAITDYCVSRRSSRTWSLRWDCNKQTRDAQTFLARRYAQSSTDRDPEGVAAFLQAYHKPGGGGHSVLAILVDGRTWKYFDAMNGAWNTETQRAVWYSGD